MARAVRSILAGIVSGDAASVRSAAAELHEALLSTPPLPADPVEAVLAVDEMGAELAGTWQEVRAARDYGDLSAQDYESLAAALDSLTLEV